MQDPKSRYHRFASLRGARLTSSANSDDHLVASVLEKSGFESLRNRVGASGETRTQSLQKFSITTLEEAVGAAIASPRALAGVIGMETVEQLRRDDFREASSARFPALARFPELRRQRAFGASIGRPLAGRDGVTREAVNLPPTDQKEFSLINACMPPIRDQGQRWTCVAFATCALVEYANCRNRQTTFDASEQFHYWDTKCNDPDGYSSLGTYPEISFSRIAQAGVCREASWPYNPITDPPQSDPHGPANLPEAQTFRVSASVQIRNHRDVSVLKRYLHDGNPVAIAIPVYDSWALNPAVEDSGNIGLPLPGETSDAGHALVLAGYADDLDFPGGGFFIIRNSHGTGWGTNCPFGAGYGTIPYKYIADHNYSAFIVRA